MSTRVLPEPAPASTSSGPSPWVTASRCGGFSSASRRSTWRRARLGRPQLGLGGHQSSIATAPARLPAALGSLGTQPPAVEGPRFGFSSRTSPSAGLPSSSRQPALQLADPLREALDRVGDRVRQVDPVGVGALDPAALDPDRVAGIADHGGVGRHVLDHDRVGADLGAVADRDRAQQLGAGADRDVVLDRRVALAAREPGAAEGDALVERHPVADLGRLADHDAGPVVDEQVGADPGRRMDLDPGHRPARVGERHRHQRHPGLVQGVGDAVGEDRLHAGPVHEDLGGADAARRGVAIARRGDVRPDLLDHALQGAEAEHGNRVGPGRRPVQASGAKKGSDM